MGETCEWEAGGERVEKGEAETEKGNTCGSRYSVGSRHRRSSRCVLPGRAGRCRLSKRSKTGGGNADTCTRRRATAAKIRPPLGGRSRSTAASHSQTACDGCLG